MLKLKFIGSWNLKSIIVTHNDHKIYPFGRNVSGFLVYTDSGYMAVQIMMPRHYPISDKEKLNFNLVELAQTLKSTGYLAYYGTYEIDSHNQRIIHNVYGSIAQPIVGGKEIRHYKLIDNNKLILSKGNMELTWLRNG
jgi:lipocalin-like protein